LTLTIGTTGSSPTPFQTNVTQNVLFATPAAEFSGACAAFQANPSFGMSGPQTCGSDGTLVSCDGSFEPAGCVFQGMAIGLGAGCVGIAVQQLTHCVVGVPLMMMIMILLCQYIDLYVCLSFRGHLHGQDSRKKTFQPALN
jgi:hypothetical protein